jgi:S1-C subfamily serine protease
MKRFWIAISLAIVFLLTMPVPAQSVSDVFKRVKDSVVVIRTTEMSAPPVAGGTATSVGGLGSGVLIDRLGLVLTAAHVVQVAEEIQVEFTSGEVISAKVQGSVPAADLAILKLERAPKDAIAATLGDSDRTEVGDQIFIVGAPLGISYTLTVGHISARRRSDQLWGGFTSAEMFQTDAAINHGNSGGPMFNMKGEVIGIVSSMISKSGGYEGLGFVVTSNLAQKLVLDNRAVWTGMEGYVLQGGMAHLFNVPQPMGVLVQRVAANSPAARIGLRPGTIRAEIEGEEILIGGDVVLAVEGIAATDRESFVKIRALMNGLKPGQEITVTVLREGKTVDLSGVLIEE